MVQKFMSEFPSTCFLEKQVDTGFMYIFFHIHEHIKLLLKWKTSHQESATLAIYCRREGAGGNYLCGQSPTEEQEPTDTTNLEVGGRTYTVCSCAMSIRCRRKLVGTSKAAGSLIRFTYRCEEYSPFLLELRKYWRARIVDLKSIPALKMKFIWYMADCRFHNLVSRIDFSSP